jgi:uncharacterized protein YegL
MSLKSVTMDKLTAGSGYQFSATKIKDLGSTQYTLVTICCDASPSVSAFKDQLEKCLETIVVSCGKSAIRDNLLIRLTQFDGKITELHGFKLLKDIDATKDYANILNMAGNSTNLFDAADEAVGAVVTYGKKLAEQDFLVNAVTFLLTDGQDNDSAISSAAELGKRIAANRGTEKALESLNTVLIGVTRDDANLNSYLQAVKDDAGFNQYVSIGTATAGKLAKLAQWVSQSISSTSSALGSGAPSQPLPTQTFGF